MNIRNKLRLIPIIVSGFLALYGITTWSNDLFSILVLLGFVPLFLFYSIRYVKQYKQVEIEGTSKSFEDSTT